MQDKLTNQFSGKFALVKRDTRDPDPWLALYLDRSIQIDDEAKAALLLSMSSKSRAFFLPLIRPFLWLFMQCFTLFRLLCPNALTSSSLLHRLIYVGLEYFCRPEANFLILRHFHIGSEILAFIEANTPVEVKLSPLKPEKPADVLEDLFLKHDLNLYNFVINLNTKLREKNIGIEPSEQLNFANITDGGFPLETFRNRWTNFIDVQSAIEIYTPIYQLFLSQRDFWRAANSLQLDETIGLYVARLLGDAQYLGLLNNKHPLVPLSITGAGFRLMTHGLAAEALHAILREHKRKQNHTN